MRRLGRVKVEISEVSRSNLYRHEWTVQVRYAECVDIDSRDQTYVYTNALNSSQTLRDKRVNGERISHHIKVSKRRHRSFSQ